MLLIILLMLAGIIAGFFVTSREHAEKFFRINGKVQQIATVFLLFVMGLWLGGNPEFWRNIKITGLHGLLFAVVSIAGSVLGVFVFSKYLLRGEK